MALQKVISASRKLMAANSGDVNFLRIRGHSGRGSAIKQQIKNVVAPEKGCQLTDPSRKMREPGFAQSLAW